MAFIIDNDVTWHLSMKSPDITVITAVPGAIALIVPSETVTILPSEEFQITGSVESSGVSVTERDADSPTFKIKSCLSTIIPVVGLTTVTLHLSEQFPDSTIMSVVPGATPVITPSSTVAILVLVLIQVKNLSVAFDGMKSTSKISIWPFSTFNTCLFKEISVSSIT